MASSINLPGKDYLARSYIGVAQTVFLVNRVFVSCQKGAVLTKTVKMRICILPAENKGFAPQTPENDENDEMSLSQRHVLEKAGLVLP